MASSPHPAPDRPRRPNARFPVPTRFLRDEQGIAAIEFGMVALPFFAIMMAIVETFLLFFASQTIETATDVGARLIRTGQAQTGGFDEADFKNAICDAMAGLFNCEANLRVDVRTYAQFALVDMTRPIDEERELVEDFTYTPGAGGDIVVVRAFYEWPLHTNLLGLGLANLASGKYLIAATAAFRNEPF